MQSSSRQAGDDADPVLLCAAIIQSDVLRRGDVARFPTRAGTLIAVREAARLAGVLRRPWHLERFWRSNVDATVGHEQADGRRGMDRFVFDDSAGAVLAGQDALVADRRGSARAILVIDAYVQLDTGRTDALIIEAVRYGPAGQSMKMAVPYRPESGPEGFAVYRPKFIAVIGVDEPDYAALGEVFFAGVDCHEPPAAVWNAHLDQAG